MFAFGPPADRSGRREWWRRQVERQRDSNVPVPEFCRRLGIRPVTFYSWRRRLSQSPPPGRFNGRNQLPSHAGRIPERNSQPRRIPEHNGQPNAPFVPVSLRAPDSTTQLEIALGNACVVRLTGVVDPELLRTAIRATGRLQGPGQGAK